MHPSIYRSGRICMYLYVQSKDLDGMCSGKMIYRERWSMGNRVKCDKGEENKGKES